MSGDDLPRRLNKCFEWMECRRDGERRHVLLCHGDFLAKLERVQDHYQHCVCMARGFDGTLNQDPGWMTAQSYPKTVELHELGMPNFWGIIDMKRCAAIHGGGKLQKRMLAMCIMLALAAKRNRYLPSWWTTDCRYISDLFDNICKELRGISERSRSPKRPVKLLTSAAALAKSEEAEASEPESEAKDDAKAEPESSDDSKSEDSESRGRKRKKKKKKKFLKRVKRGRSSGARSSSRTMAAMAVDEKLRDKAELKRMEKLQEELAAQKQAAEQREAELARLLEEKEAAAREAQAEKDRLVMEKEIELQAAKQEKERLEIEKEQAEQAAQAAAESEEQARRELKTLAQDTAKVMEAVHGFAAHAADQLRQQTTKCEPSTTTCVKTEIKAEPVL